MALSNQQAACLLQQAGWTQDLIPTMVAVGHAESGLDPGAVNSDPSVASAPPTGWLQVRAFSDRTARWDLSDPLQNAQAAKSVYDAQGLGAWTTYPGQSAQFLPQVQQDLQGFDYGSCGGAATPSPKMSSGTGLMRGRAIDPWGIGQGIADAAGYTGSTFGAIGRTFQSSGTLLLGLVIIGGAVFLLGRMFLEDTSAGRALRHAGGQVAKAAAVAVPK